MRIECTSKSDFKVFGLSDNKVRGVPLYVKVGITPAYEKDYDFSFVSLSL